MKSSRRKEGFTIKKKLSFFGFVFYMMIFTVLNMGCTGNGRDTAYNHAQQMTVRSATPTPTPALESLSTAASPNPEPVPVTPAPKLSNSPAAGKETVGQALGKGVGNSVLLGKVICIDPGHQAKADHGQEPIAPGANATKEKMTTGTAGVATGIPEYKLNLAVSMKLKEELEKRGARIVMTRDTGQVNSSNIERAKLANSANAGLVIRIHADGIEDASVKGMSILYPGSRYIADKGMLKDSRSAAEKVLSAMVKSTGAVNRGIIERNDMTGFNWSTVPVILIEMGFMTNGTEDRNMNTPEYQDKLIAGMIKGIEDYFTDKAAG